MMSSWDKSPGCIITSPLSELLDCLCLGSLASILSSVQGGEVSPCISQDPLAGMWPQLFLCVAEGCAGGRAGWDSSGSLPRAVGRAQPSRDTQQGHTGLALGPTTASGWWGEQGMSPDCDKLLLFRTWCKAARQAQCPCPGPAGSGLSLLWCNQSHLFGCAGGTVPSSLCWHIQLQVWEWVRIGEGTALGEENSGASCHQPVRRVNGRCGCENVLYF